MVRLLILLLFCIGSINAQVYYQPTNMSFEGGDVGKTPPAWEINTIAEKAGYEVFKDLSDPFDGKYHAVIQKIGEPDKTKDSISKTGAIYQRIDALSYRDYKVQFQIALKTEFENRNGAAHIFLEIKTNSENDEPVLIIDLDNPIISDEWNYYNLSADIPSDANNIRYGILMKGRGVVKMDDASLDIIQPDGVVNIQSDVITKEGIDNLYSLAKAYGYTRFFYPGETVKSMNWDMFMIKAVEEIENISDSTLLVEKLNSLFKYPAPLSEINYSKNNPKNYIEKPDNALDYYALGWMHSGGFAPRSTEHIYSTVHNVYNSLRPREAAAFQVLDLSEYRKKTIIVTANIKTENLPVGSGAMIWLRADNDVKKMTAFQSSSKYPGNYPEWTKVTTELKIPNNAELLRLGAVFVGEGIAYFDNFTAITSDGDTLNLKNPDFEIGKPGQLENGWLVPGSVMDAGYKAIVQEKHVQNGDMALRFSSSLDDKISFPEIGKIFSLKLSDGLYMHMPSVLYADSSGVLPANNIEFDYTTENKPEGFFPNANDRSSRLAIAVMAWSIIDNFSLRNIPDDQMYDIFSETLNKAVKVSNHNDFLLVIRNLLKYTGDSQARIWFENQFNNDALPILIEKIDNKLFVSKVHQSVKDTILPGYEIVEINEQPAYDYIADIASQIPSGTKQWGYERAIAIFRSGKYNSEVNVKLEDLDGKQFDYLLERNIGIGELHPDRLPEVYEIDSTLLYLDITVLNDRFFKNNLNQINQFENLILDARGTADISEHTLGLFIESPILSSKWEIPVYTFPDKSIISRKSIQGIIKGHNKLPNKNVVILTDARSIGYIEGILHIAQQYNIATIIGTPSAGMPGDVLAFRLPGNYNFSMTVMRAYAPDGKLITGSPVKPDIEVEIQRNDLKNDIDPILKKGLDSFIK